MIRLFWFALLKYKSQLRLLVSLHAMQFAEKYDIERSADLKQHYFPYTVYQQVLANVEQLLLSN